MRKSADQALPSLSRRTFVAAAATTGAAAALGLSGCSPKADTEAGAGADAEGAALDPYADAQVFYSTCPPECQHHNLKGYVVDGKLVKVESSELNDCAACARGISRSQMVNDPDRLTMPLLLDGEKGSGQFKEISWDEAFDLIEQKFKDAIATDGNKSICYVTGSGNFGAMHGPVANAFFGHLGGASTTVGSLCCAGTTAAIVPIYGKRFLDCRNQIESSTYVVVWGNNPAISKQGYFQRFEHVVENGGKLVVIDPIYTESAAKATDWLQPWPGTDAALGLAMLKVIVDERLYDEEFLLAHTCAPCLVDRATGEPVLKNADDPASFVVFDKKSGEVVPHDQSGIEAALTLDGTDAADAYQTEFELIVAEASAWDLVTAEEECGVPAADIERIAKEYAGAEHAMIVQNMGGFMRTENGTYATAVGAYLAAFCGQVGHVGDGVSDAGGMNEVATGNPLEVPKATEEVAAIPRFTFGEAVLNEDPVKVNVLWSMTGNPMTQWPNTGMVKKALEKIPFVVTVRPVPHVHGAVLKPRAAVHRHLRDRGRAGQRAQPLDPAHGEGGRRPGRVEERPRDLRRAGPPLRLRRRVRRAHEGPHLQRAGAHGHHLRRARGEEGRRRGGQGLHPLQGRRVLHRVEESRVLGGRLEEGGLQPHLQLRPLRGRRAQRR